MGYYFKTEKVSAGYDGRPVVEDLNIEIETGSILTLIGPNGAGKSTVLKTIARQLKLISGTISIDKKDLMAMTPEDVSKTMAIVMTEKISSEMMTCRDVVSTGRYPYTGRFGILSPDDEKKVDEAMDLADITGIGERDFKKISDGQRQRVMLARALCQEPEIIILDEPTSFLDIRYKLEFLSLLEKLKNLKGLTVIMSLHELELAKKISDRILCIGENGPERFGTPKEIFKDGYISKLFNISDDLLSFAKDKEIGILNT